VKMDDWKQDNESYVVHAQVGVRMDSEFKSEPIYIAVSQNIYHSPFTATPDKPSLDLRPSVYEVPS